MAEITVAPKRSQTLWHHGPSWLWLLSFVVVCGSDLVIGRWLLLPIYVAGFYGGMVVNYSPSDKWNVNVNSYFYTKQYFMGLSFDNSIADQTGKYPDISTEIKPWAVINAKVSYNVWSNATIWVSGSNPLGKQRQFGCTDNIGTTIMFGLQWGY